MKLAATFLLLTAVVALSAKAPQPPPDWKLELVAQAPEIRHPSVVCVAPDGRVFVAEDPMDISTPRADAKEGRIICFHPNGRRTVFAENLHAVFGLQYLEGKVYVLHNPNFSVFTDDDGVGKDRFELIESMNPKPWALNWNDHVPANFKLAMDGYFYMAVGDKGVYGAVGRDGKRVDLPGGGILRLRPDGTGLEVYCTGVRNILDVALTAEDEIFTYDNTDEHDWMGRLTHMVDGGFYGYPHDFVPRRPYTLWMMHDFGGGAACGTLAYTEGVLPEEYRDNLFLADFGKRQVLRVRIERAGATWRVVSHEEFFREPSEDFRPVGIAWGADGKSFYICDWQHRDTKEKVVVGRLWKASFAGATRDLGRPAWYLPAAMGKRFEATIDELSAGLSAASKEVRLAAQRALIRGHRGDAVTKLRAVLNSNTDSVARSHALWALDGIDGGVSGRAEIMAALSDGDLMVRRQAIRESGERRVPQAVPKLLACLKDVDASIRFHAATALGRIAERDAVPELRAASNESDLFPRFAVFTALNRIGRVRADAWPVIAASLRSDNERVRESCEFAMRETYDVRLTSELARMVTNSTAAPLSARTTALRLINSLAHRPDEWKGEWGAYHPALAPRPRKTNTWQGTTIAFDALKAALGDSERGLRLLAIEGLRDADDRSATALLLRDQFSKEMDNTVRASLIRTLGEFKDSVFAPVVVRVMREAAVDDAVFSAAIYAAGRIGTAELIRALLDLAGSPELAVSRRIEVIEVVGELKASDGLSVLRPLLTGDERALRLAALRATARIGGETALENLRLSLRSESVEARREATAALGQTRDRNALTDLLGAWRAADTRESAFLALANFKDVRAVEAYLDGLTNRDSNLRKQCRDALAAVRDEALPLIERKSGSLSPEALREARLVYQNHSRAKSGPLFASASALPAPQDYARYAQEHTGDALRGQRVFFDESGVACIKCHTVAGNGRLVGPDLTLIGTQFPRKDLIEHILEPSKVVREGYQQWNIETRDGESYSGLIQSEVADNLTVIGSDGGLQIIPKNSITSRSAGKLSVMPEGLQFGLSLEQFSDLIAFLESRRSDSRQNKLQTPASGFISLLNSEDLTDWCELPTGTKRVDSAVLLKGLAPTHWSITNGVLEHDGVTGDLWTKREFTDFDLSLEWRWRDAPKWADFPLINADGVEAGLDGRAATARVLDAGDSGVFMRGLYKAQANLFCYPVGSGEFWEYRTDPNSTREQRRAFTPRKCADRPVGDWNGMQIQLRGNRVTTHLNGERVITEAELPGLPARGPIGLQHEHGRIQFRNIFVKELQ